MEDKTSLWNTKTSDLTVGDVVKLNIAAPIIMIGSLFAVTTTLTLAGKVASKFRNRKSETQDETDAQ